MLVKHTAAVVLETDPAALELAYRIGGRPFLRGFDQIDVSLSHTGDLLVVAVSRTGRIGVDAEPTGRDLSLDVLRQRMCTPAESAGLARLTPERQARGLLRLWTLKEAYTKALGQGMRLGFTEFGFGHDGAPLTADGSPAPGGAWAFTTHPVLDGRYLVSTACQDTARDTAARTMLDQGFTGAVRADREPGAGPAGRGRLEGLSKAPPPARRKLGSTTERKPPGRPGRTGWSRHVTILVTGATGAVGRLVVARLVAAGASVRAVSRTPATAGLPDQVEVFEGDLEKPETLRAALDGVDRLYLFPVPEAAREVVALAKESGVRRIVVLSSSSVLDTSGDNHSGEYHRAVERAVEQSGLDWTFVRPDEFATNLLWKWGHSIRTEGVVRAPYGDAARVLIHEDDVAAVAATALLTDGHAGQAYVLTGPGAVTQADQVRQIAQVLGRPLVFEEITPAQARKAMGQVMPQPVVEMVLGYLADAVDNPPVPRDTVEKVTGRPALTFARWAADHAADFAPRPTGGAA